MYSSTDSWSGIYCTYVCTYLYLHPRLQDPWTSLKTRHPKWGSQGAHTIFFSHPPRTPCSLRRFRGVPVRKRSLGTMYLLRLLSPTRSQYGSLPPSSQAIRQTKTRTRKTPHASISVPRPPNPLSHKLTSFSQPHIPQTILL